MLVRWNRRVLTVAGALAFLPCAALGADSIPQQQMAWEMQAGQQEYGQLMQRGEIVPQSPYYAALAPIAQRIAAVADPQYFAPFRFILVNERSPNAFSTPGGNVYVTVPMMQFAQKQDELAGVLCHEVSHDIHHDVYNNNRSTRGLQIASSVLGAFMGPYNYLGQAAVGAGAGMQALSYSRKDETNADRAGAYLCAQAGFNPWGMVWLFQRYGQLPKQTAGAGSMEAFSDHPHDDHRITDLENLYRTDTATFGKFNDDPGDAAALASPAPQTNFARPGYSQPGSSQPGGSQPSVPMPSWTPQTTTPPAPPPPAGPSTAARYLR